MIRKKESQHRQKVPTTPKASSKGKPTAADFIQSSLASKYTIEDILLQSNSSNVRSAVSLPAAVDSPGEEGKVSREQKLHLPTAPPLVPKDEEESFQIENNGSVPLDREVTSENVQPTKNMRTERHLVDSNTSDKITHREFASPASQNRDEAPQKSPSISPKKKATSRNAAVALSILQSAAGGAFDSMDNDDTGHDGEGDDGNGHELDEDAQDDFNVGAMHRWSKLRNFVRGGAHANFPCLKTTTDEPFACAQQQHFAHSAIR
jgi:hypothetical protein